MTLIAFGLNHKTAPIAIREQLVFTPMQLPMHLQAIVNEGPANEAVILSTCNRTEFYCDDKQAQTLHEWLIQRYQINFTDSLYTYCEEQAVKHIMRVASGLDSMLLGEHQIFGQMKQAFAIAQQAGTVGKQLSRLFQHVFSTSKHIRTCTEIGVHPISIAYMAVNLAKRIFADLSKTHVLLIGAGETITSTAQYLKTIQACKLIIANRSYEKALALAKCYNCAAIKLEEIADFLKIADIIIIATHSQTPLIGYEMVLQTLKARKRKPMLMVDLSVPRNIEPSIAELDDVYLYTLDNLQAIVQENWKNRKEAAEQAEHIIEQKANQYMQWRRSLTSVNIIRQYRQNSERYRDIELNKALHRLNQGGNSADILINLAHSLTNKLTHATTINLHKAASEQKISLLHAAQELLDLDPK